MLELLRDVLVEGPALLDVELTAPEYAREEPKDFSEDAGPLELPPGAFLYFELDRKTVSKKGASTRTADDPAADAGAPRYVVPSHYAPDWVPPDFKADFDPDWPLWVPNPEIPGSAGLLADTCRLIRPVYLRLEDLAFSLREAGHTLRGGGTITADNVRRIVVAAELLLENQKPDCVP